MKRLGMVALLVVLFAAMLPSGATVLAAEETLIVPFENGPFGAETANTYSGMVTIRVSGYGQSAGSAYNDAFYIFTDGDGNSITPEHIPDFYLMINGQPVTDYTRLPPYRDDHTYEFTILITDSRLRFTFGVGDWYTIDNTGSFTITVKSGPGDNFAYGLLIPKFNLPIPGWEPSLDLFNPRLCTRIPKRNKGFPVCDNSNVATY